jgi:hypothetical protein
MSQAKSIRSGAEYPAAVNSNSPLQNAQPDRPRGYSLLAAHVASLRNAGIAPATVKVLGPRSLS